MGTLGLSLPQMMMGIDKARTDDLACTVDDLGVLIRRVYVRCNVGDKAIAYQKAVVQ